MSLIEQRAKILDPRTHNTQPFSLSELMHGIPDHPDYFVQRGSCVVLGTILIPKGTAEFEEAIKKQVDSWHLKGEEAVRATQTLQKNPLLRCTPFRAFRHVNDDGKTPLAEGMPYQGILTDMRWLTILCMDDKDMTIIPFGDLKGGPHCHLFHDAFGAKLANAQWLYTGSFVDALTEFHETRGFSINLAKLPSTLEERQIVRKQYYDPATPSFRRIHGVLTDTNLSLEQVLAIIAQDPNMPQIP